MGVVKFRIIGNTKPIRRAATGLYSFDRAFINYAGDIGFPMYGIVEVAGPTGHGKTTMTLGLAGTLGKVLGCNIAFADIEGFESGLLETIIENTGFSGDLYMIDGKRDEEVLEKLVDIVFSKNCIGIFDSVGALSPISEVEGDIGEANMGRRAIVMAQFSRRVAHRLKDSAEGKVIFVINHMHPIIGGRGFSTPGGETMKYISTIQIRMRRVEEWKDGSYAIEGEVRKNRFGFKDRKFYIVVLSGLGVHHGLTAFYDCYKLGLISRQKVVKMSDVSFGYLKDIFQKAREGDEDFFEPFHKALQDFSSSHGLVQALDDESSDD